MKSDSEGYHPQTLSGNVQRSSSRGIRRDRWYRKEEHRSIVKIRISWFNATRLIYVYSFIVEAVAYILD